MSNLIAFPSAQEFQTMKELGAMAVKSGFLPVSINTPEKAVVIMLKGRELGIPPMQAFSSIAVINGKPTMSAELMLSMIFRNVLGAIVNFTVTNEKECVIEAQRPGGKLTTFSFTMTDADRAQLTGKGPWKTYPAAMLRARCISAMARAMFPDALSGVVYTAEELGALTDHEGNVIDVPPTEPNEPAIPTSLVAEGKPAGTTSWGAQITEYDPMERKIDFGEKYKGLSIREALNKDGQPAFERWLTILEDNARKNGFDRPPQNQQMVIGIYRDSKKAGTLQDRGELR